MSTLIEYTVLGAVKLLALAYKAANWVIESVIGKE